MNSKIVNAMEKMVIGNLREIAHGYWKDGQTEDYNYTIELVEKLREGNATEQDWLEAIEQCEM